MCSSRAALVVASLLHLAVILVSAQGSGTKTPWQTLSGKAPLVVARGGFSGLFPDSSLAAYALAAQVSLPDVLLWCDVQLTKDGEGVCLPDLKLENSTNIEIFFQNRRKEYMVNGVSTSGYYSIDFTLNDLLPVSLRQPIFSRPGKFDQSFVISTIGDISGLNPPPSIWLNIQHSEFFSQHNLSMRSYVLGVIRNIAISYISSPEIGFLTSIQSRVSPKITKLVFRVPAIKDEIEPSTNQTYASILKNLTFVKTFASGILVPKNYIWPVDLRSYLQPHTTLVSDAHKAGLEVFAANFVNDFPLSYNYSYDPVSEYLNFIDNGDFSVDGVLTDFPISPSSAIDCFAHLSPNATKQAKPLVISKFGSSGDYPACTDFAYTKAIDDGADVVDCPVQITSDSVPFCLSSINLIESTNAAQLYTDRILTIKEIGPGKGIYAFNFTWDEIQKNLRPVLSSPQSAYTINRNPANFNAGKFVKLSEFLELTKKKPSLSGILISIENAAYLAQEQGLGVTDAVITALSDAGFDNQTTIKVMVQSTNSNVLEKLKSKTNYELVYKIDEEIRDIDAPTVKDIASFASSVVVVKGSVFPDNSLYLTGSTDVVKKLKSQNLSVYVETFSNEFVSQAWDFFSDATVEINTFVTSGNIDGVITDFPKTAARYRRNRCLDRPSDSVPSYMSPVQAGSLFGLISPAVQPPAEAPSPVLTEADVDEPPLPAVSVRSPLSNGTVTPTGSPPRNAQSKLASGHFLSSLAMLFVAIVLL